MKINRALYKTEYQKRLKKRLIFHLSNLIQHTLEAFHFVK